MLTAWGKKALLPSITDQILPAISNYGDGLKAYNTAKTILNNTAYTATYSAAHSINVRVRSASETEYDGIWIGSGDTPATEDDYFLESVISSGASGTSTSATKYDSTTNSLLVRITVTISNTGSSDLTINEVCKTCVFDTATAIGQSVSINRRNIMIDRTVLNEPLVIPPDSAGVFYYDFIYFDGSPEPITMATTG